jgi:uncharacterized protein YjbI with pentapeptide repeats
VAGETQAGTCEGEYKGRKAPTSEGLAQILAAHRDWLGSRGSSGQKANLCQAFLFGSKLQRAILREVDLSEADLAESNLSGADLTGANMNGADLVGANLSNATLSDAHLIGAALISADLSSAKLFLANLERANLGYATLTQADFNGAHLKGATLNGATLRGTSFAYADLEDVDMTEADLEGATFQDAKLGGASLREANVAHLSFDIKPGKLPIVHDIATARNLSTMSFWRSPEGLAQLREEFKKTGLRQQERELTYAIRRREREIQVEAGGWLRVEGMSSFLFFELPSDYGMSPSRPLKILLCFIPGFALLYLAAISR